MVTVTDAHGSSYAAVLVSTARADALARFRALNIPLRIPTLRPMHDVALPPPDAVALDAPLHWYRVTSLTGTRATLRYVIAPDPDSAAAIGRARGDGPSVGKPHDLGPTEGLPFPFSHTRLRPSAISSIVCPRCGYDLAGLPIHLTVRCPECNLACGLAAFYRGDPAHTTATSSAGHGCLAVMRTILMWVGIIFILILTFFVVMAATY